MLQLALSLLALMEPYKEKQNAQLEQYCLKYIAHYAEFEEFVRKLDSSMRLNGDLMSDCEETYNLTINFFKDVKKDERKSKSVAEKCMRFQESCGDSENLFLQEIIAQALGGQ